METTPRSLRNICQEIPPSTIPRHGMITLPQLPSPWQESYTDRAGANFSAISGSDKNALIWDKAGYKRLMKLAVTHGPVAGIATTQSREFWDEKPAEEKLRSLSSYLEDVSASLNATGLLLIPPKVHRTTLA